MENIQPQMDQEMTAEEAKASLGVSTRLMDELLMMQGQQNGMRQEEPPQAEQKQETPQNEPQKEEPPKEHMAEMDGKFEQFKEDINKTIDDKFNQLGAMIKEALKDEDEKE